MSRIVIPQLNTSYILAQTPHIGSVVVVDGGTGYTHAKATITPAFKGALVRLKIVAGVITEGTVIHPGHGFTSVPTITVEGDGSGAQVRAVIEGGCPGYDNTTTVDDWRGPACPGYSATPIPPEPVPACDPLVAPCDCSDVLNYVTNTYELKDPPAYVDYSSCTRAGFKNAFARKEWFGQYGYCNAAPSQVKYLVEKITHRTTDSIAVCDGFCDGYQESTITESITIRTTDRYSGTVTEVVTGDAEPFGTSPIPVPACVADFDTTTCTGVIGEAKSRSAQTKTDDKVTITTGLYWPPSNRHWDTNCVLQLNNPGSDAGCGVDIEACVSTSYEGYRVNLEETIYELSSPYTSTDVTEDCQWLLDQMDLCDDGKFPWRTDVPAYAGNHYTPQLGPSFGPLACWQNDNSNNAVLQIANPCGYDPHWDSLHLQELYGDGGGGFDCWLTDSRGAYTPEKFGTAMKWMPDLTNNMFLPGAHVCFNSAPREYSDCSGDPLILDQNTLYMSKWAEIYVSAEFPHHNEARDPNGCKPDDELTRNPDTIDCNYNPTGDLQFPNAADCTNHPLNSTTKLGSYSVKSWNWDETGMVRMDCAYGRLQPCVPCIQAVFIQKEQPTGIYSKALRIDPPSIGNYFDGTYSTFPHGRYALVQFQQSMVDPLWKRPAECIEDVKTEDEEALIPYEENTDCISGLCFQYTGNPFISRCEPDEQHPWAYEAPIVIDEL